MTSNDFTGAVALDLFRAAIPADDVARLIQHENRVILDTVNQEPELFFAVTQLYLRQPECGLR